jgi:hypothetical protein
MAASLSQMKTVSVQSIANNANTKTMDAKTPKTPRQLRCVGRHLVVEEVCKPSACQHDEYQHEREEAEEPTIG